MMGKRQCSVQWKVSRREPRRYTSMGMRVSHYLNHASVRAVFSPPLQITCVNQRYVFRRNFHFTGSTWRHRRSLAGRL